MQTKPPSSFCARAAIAAALAFGSTAGMAQEADVPTIAPPAPAAAPAPTPGAPQVVTRSEPVVQQVPAAPQAAPEAATAQPARPARSQPAPRATAQRTAPPAPVAVAPAAVAPAAAPAAILPSAPPAPVDPVVAPAPVAVTAPAAVAPVDDGLTGTEAGLIALLAAAGLAGAGLLFARSRRKRDEDLFVEETAMAPAPVAMAGPASEPVPEPEPVFVREPALERFARPAAPLPAGPVAAGDARTALLERMIAAEPDEDNPYVSRKRRVRRARMLLAEREAAAPKGSGDQFDWRTYKPSSERSEAEDRAPVPHPT